MPLGVNGAIIIYSKQRSTRYAFKLISHYEKCTKTHKHQINIIFLLNIHYFKDIWYYKRNKTDGFEIKTKVYSFLETFITPFTIFYLAIEHFVFIFL